MSLWRLEWLRLLRSYALLALVAVFVLFGVTGPVLAAYLPDILRSASGQEGLVIQVPDPVPADAIAQYVGNAAQIGLLVVVVVAALALAVDARSGRAAFYRTRVPSALRRLAPRVVASAGAAVLAWTVGLGLAVGVGAVLLGAVPAGAVALGWALWALYLVFAVSVVALAASLARGVAAVSAVALGLLLLLPIVGLVPQVGEWLPSALVGAPDALVRGSAHGADFARPAGVAALGALAAVGGATALADRREV